ncbi:MAG: hypothetical protein GY913_07720 [Proteobacteria bacterium]|nr:hypothetical protein [Pseudomonadota bacterium]MCP4916799.1 hypothetical protein [Pseudomonadota bacterium]
MRGTASLDVYDDALPTSLEVRATSEALDPPLLRAAPGQRYLRLSNDSKRPLRILVEGRPRPAGTMTLGRLLQHHPDAFDLLPFEARHDQVERWTGAVLAVRGDVEAQGARHVYESSQGQIATFATAQALRDLGALNGIGVGISAGEILDVSIGERRVPTGPAVERALSAMASTPRGIPATPAVMDDDLDAAFAALGLSRRNAGLPTQTAAHWLE